MSTKVNEIVMVNGIEVDTDKAQKMMRKIIINEKKNLSTKELDNLKMIRKIKKMIEEEVECYLKR